MERTIIAQADLEDSRAASRTTQGTKDGYLDRVIKMIPAEVVAIYLFIDGIVKTLPKKPEGEAPGVGGPYPPIEALSWFFFLIFIPLCALYLFRIAKVKKNLQILESVGAYIAWVFAIGGPFIFWKDYLPAYGSIVVALYSFVIPIVDPKAGKFR